MDGRAHPDKRPKQRQQEKIPRDRDTRKQENSEREYRGRARSDSKHRGGGYRDRQKL